MTLTKKEILTHLIGSVISGLIAISLYSYNAGSYMTAEHLRLEDVRGRLETLEKATLGERESIRIRDDKNRDDIRARDEKIIDRLARIETKIDDMKRVSGPSTLPLHPVPVGQE